MSSWTNLKDAGRMMPTWVVPFLLAGTIIGLYVIARYTTVDKPHELVAFASMTAIVLSFVVGFTFLMSSIINAKQGNVLAAIGDGFQRALTYIWVASGVSLFTYVCSTPLYRLITENLYYSLTAAAVTALLFAAYWASGLRAKPEPGVDSETGVPSTSLTLPTGFAPSMEQRPAFQVTMADQSRLLIHIAARIIAYKGSNCIIADSFSAFMDLNARTGKIFSDMNLLSSKEMLYWRLHMLLMGSAAEQVIRNSTSEAAIDDLQSFDELALRYLHISGKSSSFKPVSESEAMIKHNRILMLRQSIMSRCITAAEKNRRLILEIVKLMRGRSVVVYEDLKHIIDRVEMPGDFPIAEFDSNEVMERTLMQLDYDGPDTFEAEDFDESPAEIARTQLNSNVRPFTPAGTATLQA